MNVLEWITTYGNWITIGLGIFSIILFISIIILSIKLNKLQDKYEYFMGGGSAKPLEALLMDYISKVSSVEEENERIIEAYKVMRRDIDNCIQKVGIVRYNAFGDAGGELCYAIALLDEHDDGIVINGIHSRENSYTYAKPIEKGRCNYALSAEEEQAIQKAQLRNKMLSI
ncbi:MAG: DUF4446 family protein [Epulopiscium sp.]|nr:DUF4446 family protein [Candidatus Epulonipiscium sp.]